MNVDIKIMRFALSWLIAGSLIVLLTACDLGTYGQRFEKSKANRPALESIVSKPAGQAAPADPPAKTANQPVQPGFAQPRNSGNRNLPAAAVGGGGG
ncbi:MAG: hypothetical protein MK108_09970 [Mariniblastus sp.]|nr:hypothetical protein [Mariniblastus sp.]